MINTKLLYTGEIIAFYHIFDVFRNLINNPGKYFDNCHFVESKNDFETLCSIIDNTGFKEGDYEFVGFKEYDNCRDFIKYRLRPVSKIESDRILEIHLESENIFQRTLIKYSFYSKKITGTKQIINAKHKILDFTNFTPKITIPSTAAIASVALIALLVFPGGILTSSNLSQTQQAWLTITMPTTASNTLSTMSSNNIIQTAYAVSNPDEALSYYNNILQQDNKNIPALIAKASILSQQGQYEDSLQVFNYALSLEPDNLSVRLLRDDVAVQTISTNEITQKYDEFLAKHPDNVPITIAKAALLENNNEISEAIQIYDSYLQKHPDNLEVQLFSDRLKISQNIVDSTALVNQYDSVIQNNPTDRDAVLLQSNALSMIGESDKAVQTYLNYLTFVTDSDDDIGNDIQNMGFNTPNNVNAAADVNNNNDNYINSIINSIDSTTAVTTANNQSNDSIQNSINSIVSADPAISVALANSLISQNQIQAAQSIYQTVLAQDPTNVAANIGLDNALIAQGVPLDSKPDSTISMVSFTREVTNGINNLVVATPEEEKIDNYDPVTGDSKSSIIPKNAFRFNNGSSDSGNNTSSGSTIVPPQSSIAVETIADSDNQSETHYVLDMLKQQGLKNNPAIVNVLDSKGRFLQDTIYLEGCNLFGAFNPQMLAVDDTEKNRIYTVCNENRQDTISAFDLDSGHLIQKITNRQFPISEKLQSLELSPSGNYLYVSYAKNIYQVDVRNSSDSTFRVELMDINNVYNENNSLINPIKNPYLVLATNDDSYIYVIDEGNRMSKVSTDKIDHSTGPIESNIYLNDILPAKTKEYLVKNNIAQNSEYVIQPLVNRDGQVCALDLLTHTILNPGNCFDYDKLYDSKIFPDDYNDEIKCNADFIENSVMSDSSMLKNLQRATTPSDLVSKANEILKTTQQYEEALLFYYLAAKMSTGADNIPADIWNGIGYAQTQICFDNHNTNNAPKISYDKALKIDPENINALTGLGSYHQTKMSSFGKDFANDAFQANKYFKQALAIDPNNVNALNGIAYTSSLIGETGWNDSLDSVQAISQFEKTLSNNPKDINALNGIAETLYNMGNAQAAISYYAQALNIDDNNIHTLTGLFESHIITGDATMALEYVDMIKDHDEMVSSMLTEQGMWLHDNGQLDSAESFFAKAVDKNPANVQAKSMLR